MATVTDPGGESGAIPLDGPEAGHGLELAVAELDVGGADDARVEAQGRAHLGVGGGRGVVAHEEVVAARVSHLVRGDGAREREDAPVGDAADDAAVAEDELSGGQGDAARVLAVGLARFEAPGLVLSDRENISRGLSRMGRHGKVDTVGSCWMSDGS
jgi:hypothetical protein